MELHKTGPASWLWNVAKISPPGIRKNNRRNMARKSPISQQKRLEFVHKQQI